MKLRNLLLLLSLALTVTPIFADDHGCDEDTIHCAYVSGIAGQGHGRYIKATYKNISVTSCFSESDGIEVLPENGQKALGANSIAFEICKDENGKKCQPLGVDNFTVSQAGDQYIGTPKFYDINLYAVQANYPKCLPHPPTKRSLLP